jgi:alkylation response protein AidB-like acyl-CoA dehydrogenase
MQHLGAHYTDSIQAEEALNWLLSRDNAEHKKPFGKLLSEQGVILAWIAQSRIEIDAARLIVLNAAAAIDTGDAKTALIEIAQAKILVPSMALAVIDRAVQAYGGQGVCRTRRWRGCGRRFARSGSRMGRTRVICSSWGGGRIRRPRRRMRGCRGRWMRRMRCLGSIILFSRGRVRG